MLRLPDIRVAFCVDFCKSTWAIAVAVIGFFPMIAGGAGIIASSLEQYNFQTGPSALTVRSFDAFDEISEIPGVTGLTVQVNNGPVENVAFNPLYNAFKRRQSWGSAAEMVSARPIDATIVHTLQGSPSGTVSITAPGIAYADAIPVNPIFTLSGAPGHWTYNSQGEGILNVNVSTVDSFTVRLNRYTVGTQGLHFFYSVLVSDALNGSRIDEQHSGLLAAGTAATRYSMTFTRGLPLDGGDSDPTTYGFTADSLLRLEGEFGNIFGLADAGLGDGVQRVLCIKTTRVCLFEVFPSQPFQSPRLTRCLEWGFCSSAGQ